MNNMYEKSLRYYDVKDVENLRNHFAAAFDTLNVISKLGNGPDRGSPQWQIDCATSLAHNCIMGITSGKPHDLPESLKVIFEQKEDAAAVQEAKRQLKSIVESLNSIQPKSVDTTDVRVKGLVRLFTSLQTKYNELYEQNGKLHTENKSLKAINESLQDEVHELHNDVEFSRTEELRLEIQVQNLEKRAQSLEEENKKLEALVDKYETMLHDIWKIGKELGHE